MKRSFENSLEVLELAEKELLYEKLVLQIKKDFDRANTKLNFPSNILPSDLVEILHEKIYFLLLEKFQECLNLLYMVDVSERDIKKNKVFGCGRCFCRGLFLAIKEGVAKSVV